MKKKAVLGTLMLFIVAGIALLAIAQTVDAKVPAHCGDPSLLDIHACQELEHQILNSTVRMLLESWTVLPGEKGYDIQYSMGHATVMAGRYLVAHNHFELPLNIRSRAGDAESFVVIYLFNAGGEQLFKGPLTEFELVLEEAETVVFAHKDEGFFEKLGFVSADFQSWDSLSLEPGSSVAQIDWDGERTRVDWVTVQEMIFDNGTPRLILADGTKPGASGGGIFWKGLHVANNWRIEERIGLGGELVDVFTTAALNSAAILNRGLTTVVMTVPLEFPSANVSSPSTNGDGC